LVTDPQQASDDVRADRRPALESQAPRPCSQPPSISPDRRVGPGCLITEWRGTQENIQDIAGTGSAPVTSHTAASVSVKTHLKSIYANNQ
jgi:hypothetical protein